MKAILQKVPVTTDFSFTLQNFSGPYFNIPWHFHPEIELVLVRSGYGKKFIGNNITDFSPGSLVLLGSNLPHWYRNDDAFYSQSSNLSAESTVIQFSSEFLGAHFLNIPELTRIRQLLDTSKRGLEILGETRMQVTQLLEQIEQTQGMDRLLMLLNMLNVIAKTSEYSILSTQENTPLRLEDSQRIDEILQFVMNHFTENISTNQVSAEVNMSSSAFCRYFKKRTRKTFTTFLNEIRISHACRLLIEKEISIADACFMSGYNNVSYFNRQFRDIKKMSPKQFRSAYMIQS